MDAPVDDLLRIVPTVLHQLTSELVRRGDECLIASPESQLSACFLLGLRALSLINGMESVLRPELRDSFEVLARAHLESRAHQSRTVSYQTRSHEYRVGGQLEPDNGSRPSDKVCVRAFHSRYYLTPDRQVCHGGFHP